MSYASRMSHRYLTFIGVVLALAGALNNARAANSQEVQNLKIKAAAGDANAQLFLARAYDSGHGIRANIGEAAKWYEAAAQQGNAEAQNSIGSLYLSGEGVKKDPVSACEWFKKSAAQQNTRGIGNLGTCYDFGIGVEKDQVKAAQLYEQAADGGDLQSMLNIGVDYWRGEGVERNLAKAYRFNSRRPTRSALVTRSDAVETQAEPPSAEVSAVPARPTEWIHQDHCRNQS